MYSLFRKFIDRSMKPATLALLTLLAALSSLPAAAASVSGQSSAANPDAARPTILVLGDSLSAEYGLPRDTGWVHLLQQRLQQSASHYSVSNASISGDTTSSGVSRLPALLKRLQPAIVIVELGSNDALRGIPIALTRKNLLSIIALAKTQHAQVLLVGMQIPPNFGQHYTEAFAALFPDLAQSQKVALVPFLLNGIADKPAMFQADQLHPLPEAQPVLLDNVWKPLQSFIQAKRPGVQ